jgi:hypothetical protein
MRHSSHRGGRVVFVAIVALASVTGGASLAALVGAVAGVRPRRLRVRVRGILTAT